jgi:dUTP pyrophosphatase
MTKILIKRLSKDVPLPKYETDGSSGLDLSANIDGQIEIKPGKSKIIPTGLAVAVPKEFEIQIRPRSGLAVKNQIGVLNSPGTIDSDYRGELKVILINLGDKSFFVEKGLRVAQMVLSPIAKAELKEVDSLEITKRGAGGFGSTGAK